MPTLISFLLFAVVAAAFAAVVLFAMKAVRPMNSSSFQQLAAQQGWSYRDSAPELVTRWSGPPFQGGGGEARQVFSGLVDGLPFTAFQYFRMQRTDDGGHSTVPFAVVTIPLPATLPLLWVTPENALSQFTNTLGSRDIAFESADFNAAYTVAADTDQFAFAVIHPRMMEYLLASPYRSWSLRIEGDDLIFSSIGPLRPDRLAATAGWLAGFVQLIPTHVYDQYAVAAGTQSTADAAAPPNDAYAGSTTGLLPELPRGQAVATGAGVVSGVLSVVVSLAIAAGFYSLALPRVSPSSIVWWVIVIIPVVGVLTAIGGLARKLQRLFSSGAAVSLNRRDRTTWIE